MVLLVMINRATLQADLKILDARLAARITASLCTAAMLWDNPVQMQAYLKSYQPTGHFWWWPTSAAGLKPCRAWLAARIAELAPDYTGATFRPYHVLLEILLAVYTDPGETLQMPFAEEYVTHVHAVISRLHWLKVVNDTERDRLNHAFTEHVAYSPEFLGYNTVEKIAWVQKMSAKYRKDYLLFSLDKL